MEDVAVRARAAVEQVVTATTRQAVVTRVTVQHVVIGAAGQQVITTVAGQRVAAAKTTMYIGAVTALVVIIAGGTHGCPLGKHGVGPTGTVGEANFLDGIGGGTESTD